MAHPRTASTDDAAHRVRIRLVRGIPSTGARFFAAHVFGRLKVYLTLQIVMHVRFLILVISLLVIKNSLRADVGDPQIRTDDPWYPGELACSTFERLFATEAEQYRRVTGIEPTSDEDKALASWFWRNTHYYH